METSEIDLDGLARTAYLAYGKETGGLNHKGDPMPDYDDLTEKTQQAWVAAAIAIVKTVVDELKSYT